MTKRYLKLSMTNAKESDLDHTSAFSLCKILNRVMVMRNSRVNEHFKVKLGHNFGCKLK